MTNKAWDWVEKKSGTDLLSIIEDTELYAPNTMDSELYKQLSILCELCYEAGLKDGKDD